MESGLTPEQEELFKKQKELEDFVKDLKRKFEASTEKAADTYDKNLVFISSGGLALSMTFIEKIAGASPQYLLLLIITWVLLGLSLILCFVGHYISSVAHRKTKMFISNEAKSASLNTWNTRMEPLKRSISRSNSWIITLNNTAFGFLILGVITLIIFASVNTLRLHPKENDKGSIFLIQG